MKGVSSGYAESGRTRQKQRTRDQLLEAARRLIEGGDTPRVEEAAEAAGISRTTAYRYFASQAELLAAAFPETAMRSLLPAPAPEGVPERVAAVASAFVDKVEQTEHQQRAMLRLSLGDVPHELPLRQGRAIGWFSEALEPLRAELGDAGLHRLAVALRSVCGIETRAWLSDVAGLDADAVRATQLWMVDALLTSPTRCPPLP
ncbi:TetR/AcrR family transcriptional regulator [Lentzea tibetensis]|uniref:TetR/AcrR family transcriptional regulator n=1 Tax=Lentzea tibetensis TaxID=2591470 RepID=A0A563EGU5_9PSEU|nr:TetR/AcrR family transcriptional regulator [Lentzea tibetensis]